MLRTEFPFERFLQIIVPGAVVSIGLWYIHRPFLSLYFPVVARNEDILTGDSARFGGKALVFVLLTVVLGVLLRNLSDVAFATLFDDESQSEKAQRTTRRLLSFGMGLFLLSRSRDPRVCAMERYLKSPRKARLLGVIRDWCDSDEAGLSSRQEIVVAHQHLVARLRALSPDARACVAEALEPVITHSALFLALLVLLIGGALGLVSNPVASARVAAHSSMLILIVIGIIYVATLLVAYVLRRSMHHFASLTITAAIHFHEESKH